MGHSNITYLRKTDPHSASGWPTAQRKYFCYRYSANLTHAKAWKLSMGASSSLWAAVRPRFTSPGMQAPLGILLTHAYCHAKCQPHMYMVGCSSMCSTEVHPQSSVMWCSLRSGFTRQVLPTALLLLPHSAVLREFLETWRSALPSSEWYF